MKGRMHVTPTATMLSRPRRSGYRETRLLWQTVRLLAPSVSGPPGRASREAHSETERVGSRCEHRARPTGQLPIPDVLVHACGPSAVHSRSSRPRGLEVRDRGATESGSREAPRPGSQEASSPVSSQGRGEEGHPWSLLHKVADAPPGAPQSWPRSSQNLRLLTPAPWEFWGGGVQHSVHSRLCSDWWVQ